jgi:CheY-like chemotaxis protein
MAKILIVEDNEVNRDMISRRLSKRGYEIVLAVDGDQGMSMARAEKPDLILMDMSLPIVDGWQAAKLLKSDPETRSILIVALTAHAMAADRNRALEAGCDGYETKPIDLPRLLETIERLLERARP